MFTLWRAVLVTPRWRVNIAENNRRYLELHVNYPISYPNLEFHDRLPWMFPVSNFTDTCPIRAAMVTYKHGRPKRGDGPEDGEYGLLETIQTRVEIIKFSLIFFFGPHRATLLQHETPDEGDMCLRNVGIQLSDPQSVVTQKPRFWSLCQCTGFR
jgi:hypothetical protein